MDSPQSSQTARILVEAEVPPSIAPVLDKPTVHFTVSLDFSGSTLDERLNPPENKKSTARRTLWPASKGSLKGRLQRW